MPTEKMTTHQHLHIHKTKTHTSWAIKDGIAGGIVAGIVFALAEMMAGWLLQGDFFGPLRMIASILIQDIPTNISTANAIIVGGLLHFAISAFWGIIIAFLIVSSSALHQTRGRIIAFSAFMGFAIWILNFYILAPIINVPWFQTETNPFLQFLWHTFAYGAVLGWYLDATPPKDEIRT